MNLTYVRKEADFPVDGNAHHCVLLFTTVTIPGDERSRQAPGHGYPEHDEHYSHLIRFDDEEALQKWITEHNRFQVKNDYIVVSAQRHKVTTETKVKFE